MFKEIVPEVRFKGFEGKLKSNYIKKIASFSKGRGYTKNDLKNSGHPVLLYGQLYTDFKFVVESVMQFTTLKPNSVLSTGREVVVPASGETAEDLARASAIIKPGIILGGDLNIVTPTNELIPEYLAMNLTSRNPSKKIEEMAQGKSIVHIRNNNLKEIKINYPSKKEQRKITNYIILIDEVIKLKEAEISKVSNFKQAMLQKIFPKEGETVPEIRFRGFEEKWVETTLGDVSKIQGGGTPSTSNPDFWNGKINWYTPAEINSQNFVYESQKKITELGLQKSSAMILPVGTILFTSRAGIGKTAILAKEGATNQGFQSIVPDNNLLDSYFIYSRINELKKYGEEKGAGSTFVEVSGKQMAKMPIKIPKLEEQKIIGSFFKTLDQNILTKQSELKKIKQFKQAMLDKMFV